MENLKITIIGNSVALRVRPSLKHPENKNYTQYLEDILQQNIPDKIILINNFAFGATTIKDVYLKIDKYISSFPHYYIINLGVVDASTREIPLWYYKITHSKKDTLFVNICNALYRNCLIKMRPILVTIRGRRSWINKKKFKKLFDTLISTLLKETNAKIITISINLADRRIERELPGSHKNHLKYNLLMKEVADKYSVSYLDTNDFITEDFFPDGVHFSSKGHYLIAKKLSEIILKKSAKK